MTDIEKVIYNIYNYGNCKVFLLPREDSNANNVYELTTNDNGNLDITVSLEIYDKQYFNGTKFDETANLLSKEMLFDLPSDNLNIIIPRVVYSSITESKLGITCDKKENKNINTDICKLSNAVINMLNLNNKDIFDLVTSGDEAIYKILMNKSFNNLDCSNFDIEIILNDIKQKIIKIKDKYNDISNMFYELNSANTSGELNTLYRKWTLYFDSKQKVKKIKK